MLFWIYEYIAATDLLIQITYRYDLDLENWEAIWEYVWYFLIFFTSFNNLIILPSLVWRIQHLEDFKM